MEKLIFENSKGQVIEIGDTRPFILTKLEGMGGVNVNIRTQKSPFQDGKGYISNDLEPRVIFATLTIVADTEEQMVEHRKTISSIFNPKLGQGRLTYQRADVKRSIDIISEVTPTFPDAEDFKDNQQVCGLQLYGAIPFLEDMTLSSNEIVQWIGGMKFPLILPTQFATAGQNKINIVNTGDVETPITIEITGRATNPTLTNTLTGEFIRVKTILDETDKLIVTTEFGNKRVEKNGVNVFNYIDLNSTFMNLQEGDNVLEFTTDNNLDDAMVKITYRNRYMGV